jgi:magnesium transporter
MRVIAFDSREMIEEEIVKPRDVEPLLEKWPVTWFDVSGLGSAEILQEVGEIFSLHRLALEDVVNVFQRPKADVYDEHVHMVLRMVNFDKEITTEQVSLFLGRNFVLTFQENVGDVFDSVRERLRKGRPHLRRSGPDYLAYALMDAVVDAYFPVMDRFSELLEELESSVLGDPSRETLSKIYGVKRDILMFRKGVSPLREALTSLLRGDTKGITKGTLVYLQDTYDHLLRIMDYTETYRELTFDLVNLYLSTVSNRMNEIMKVLTIISTVFIPLGFIAGLYGMNFDRDVSPWNVPELGWKLGYPFALTLMGLVALVLLIFFKRRKWL